MVHPDRSSILPCLRIAHPTDRSPLGEGVISRVQGCVGFSSFMSDLCHRGQSAVTTGGDVAAAGLIEHIAEVVLREPV